MFSADLTILSAGEIEFVQRELNHAYSWGEPLLRQGSGFDLIGCNMVQESVLQQPLLVPEGSYREDDGEAGPPFVSAGIPARRWPAPGHVEFMGVMLRYAGQSVPALSGLGLDVPGGSKIGICGRTGKSCLESRHVSSPAPLAGNTTPAACPFQCSKIRFRALQRLAEGGKSKLLHGSNILDLSILMCTAQRCTHVS